MDKSLFTRYAEIKNQIKELQDEASKISTGVQKEMEEQEIDKVESDFGSFYFTTRKTWEYSPKVQELSEKLKKQQSKEQEDGTAKAKESKSLTFRAK